MSQPDQQLEDYILLLRKKVEKSRRADNNLINKAIEYGKKAHQEHSRISGELYYIHPIRVAIMATDYDLGTSAIIASLLHDIIEDTIISKSELEKEFGATVAKLVDALTKDKQNKKITLYKIFNLGHIDSRAIIIKLLDRLDNLNDIDVHARKKQKNILHETIAIYIEVAHGLGLVEIEDKMRDLTFKYLYPRSYKKISANINDFYRDRHIAINQIVQTIQDCMPKNL
ncbi:MAG: HD domain-containing protein, partial [Deltaproteobacteria bacterium]|nr:HD domain-containing protein [Deltaproteobacteria bacterium]